MNLSILLFGILPLLLFVIIDSLMGLRTALWAAIIMAIVETALSFYLFGSVDWLTALSFVLVLIMATISYRKQTAIHFKLQPVILSVIFGLTLLITSWINNPLFNSFIIKYQSQLPAEFQIFILNPLFMDYMAICNHFLGYALLLHAGITYWAALRLSNWWWIIIRGVGFYLLSFLAMILARFFI